MEWYVKQLQEICKHATRTKKVISACVTCETTIETCIECGKSFPPKINC